MGAEVVGPVSPEVLGRTAEAALSAFLGPPNPYASLPTDGYEPLEADDDWAGFGYRVDGALKAIIVLTDRTEMEPGWTVVGLRACDASEFDPATPLTNEVTVWTDADGQRASTEVIRSVVGPGHCGWESATWLHVRSTGGLYFRDPKGVMKDWTKSRYDARSSLPPDARDTGYRSGVMRLWIETGGDAYLVSPGRVERWPRSIDPLLGCM